MAPDETAASVAASERLVRIEVKLDQALVQHGDHETRLRRLERALWMVTGIAASAGGGIGALLVQALGGS
jgi:hypothetical protein